ncbi:recombinase family protein [Nocardia sp. NBC_01388]
MNSQLDGCLLPWSRADIPKPLVLEGDALDPIGGGCALIGYARVPTTGQLLDRQLHALAAAGCQKTYADKKSGKDAAREELGNCLHYMRAWRHPRHAVPRPARPLRAGPDLDRVRALRKRDIGFRSLYEVIDTTTPGGRLVLHVLAALAEFIRELIVQGTNEGLAAARACGQRLGRPPAVTDE